MTLSSTRTIRTTLASGLAVAMGTTGLLALAPHAVAATGVVKYSCSVTDSGYTDIPAFTVEVDTDTKAPVAPVKMYAGDSVEALAAGKLPGSFAQMAKAGLDADSFTGTVKTTFVEDKTNVPVEMKIASTKLGDQGTTPADAKDVSFEATGGAYKAVNPGDQVLKAGDFTANLAFAKANGSPAGTFNVSCKLPSGQPPVVDNVVVAAKSATTLTLGKTAAAYGGDVTASAKVTTTAGAPDGDVVFDVGGVKTTSKVGQDGTATATLSGLKAGAHQITASFVPKDATHYDASATAAQTLTVSKVASNTSMTFSSQKFMERFQVQAHVNGVAKGEKPTGKVKFVFKKFGTKSVKKVKTKNVRNGVAKASFGKLKWTGRYKVRVVYLGDTNYDRSDSVTKFSVRR